MIIVAQQIIKTQYQLNFITRKILLGFSGGKPLAVVLTSPYVFSILLII